MPPSPSPFHPHPTYTFTTPEACRQAYTRLDRHQQHQYHNVPYHPNEPLPPNFFATNPRYPRIPVDNWYPHLFAPTTRKSTSSSTSSARSRRTKHRHAKPPPVYAVGYDQPYYTAADWNDLWYHAMYTSYTRMRVPRVPRVAVGRLRPRVRQVMEHIESRYLDASSPYRELSPVTTMHTLRYMFRRMKKGVFVRIRNNRLDTFLPFARHNFTNDYYDVLVDRQKGGRLSESEVFSVRKDAEQLAEMATLEKRLRQWDTLMDHTDPESHDPAHFPPSVHRQYADTLHKLLKLEYECACRYARAHPPNPKKKYGDLSADPNRRRWHANNHIFNTALYLDNPNVHHFRHLFENLTTHRTSLPDFEAVLQPRDYPVFRATFDAASGLTTVYQPNPDVDTPDNHIQERVRGGFTPVLSHTGRDLPPTTTDESATYYDVPLPTVDDIEYFDQQWDKRWFGGKCDTSYVQSASSASFAPWVDWDAKTDARAVFRGSATGRGITPETNLRMRVQAIAQNPMYADLFDVHLVSLNIKPKITVGDGDHRRSSGLARVNQHAIERVLGPVNPKWKMDRATRSRYKYNLCLDGHTRADRFGAELCTGALVILPTSDGHRLWMEPFLHPLLWESRPQPLTPAVIRQHGYTHVTIDDVTQLGELMRWLVDHDEIGRAIVGNTKRWLHEHGWLERGVEDGGDGGENGRVVKIKKKGKKTNETNETVSGKTSFVYDYLEGVVRAFAKRFAYSPKEPYTLVPAIRAGTKTASHTTADTTGITGIVVGFRDSNPDANGVRTQQLREFQAYFADLFPASWKRVIVVAEQADVPGDREAFRVWWDDAFGAAATATATVTATVTVRTLLQRLEHDYRQHLDINTTKNTTKNTANPAPPSPPAHRQPFPECLVRNLALVAAPHRDLSAQCALAVGVYADNARTPPTPKQQHKLQQKWTRNECYRRVGEQKFNLGALKNAGYMHLRKTYGPALSHVVFTDIDMLPDHELAPHYMRRPDTHEVIALAHRGTSYDRFRVDDMPDYVLLGLPGTNTTSQPHKPQHKPHHKPKTRGGRRRKRRVPQVGSSVGSSVVSPFDLSSLRARRHPTRPHTQRRTKQHTQPHTQKYRQHYQHQHPQQQHPRLRFQPCSADGLPWQRWLDNKFTRFLGAAVSFSVPLFEAINGYPNTFWGWGGEDDALLVRLRRLAKEQSVTYTVPPEGRLIDLEMAQPVTTADKLGERVKEMQKREKVRVEKTRGWEGRDGIEKRDIVMKIEDIEGVENVIREVEWVQVRLRS